MKWIGLTGGIASGKSEVSKAIQERGIPVVDADKVAREVVIPGSQGLSQVVQYFGDQILAPDGSLDRVRMGKLVFADAEKLLRLEQILHPLIQSRVKKLKQQFLDQGQKLAVYDVPLLFEKRLQDQFDGIVVVWCRPEQQLERLVKRDGLSPAEAQTRIRLQVPIDEKKAKATWVIDNSGPVSDLSGKTSSILQKINSV